MEENFSPQQSLLLIQSMIDKTKDSIGNNRRYFLLWGWIALTGMLGQFFLKVIVHYRHHYLIWLISFIGVAFTIVYSKRDGQRPVKTYISESMSHLWTGMGISFFVLCVIITFLPGKSGWLYCYPFFIMMYGLGTFVSGKLLQFKPLIAGGIINWLLAIVAIFLPFDYQLLIAAAAIVSSYLIPGYMIKTDKNG